MYLPGEWGTPCLVQSLDPFKVVTLSGNLRTAPTTAYRKLT